VGQVGGTRPLLTEHRCVGVLDLIAEQEDAWSDSPGSPRRDRGLDSGGRRALRSYEALDRLRDEQAALLEINRAVAPSAPRRTLRNLGRVPARSVAF
jgi:hypothetical protein